MVRNNEAVFLLGMFFQLYVGIVHTKKVGEGRLISWPIRKRLIRYAIQKKKIGLLVIVASGNTTRLLLQIMPIWVIWVSIWWSVGIEERGYYGLVLISLYGDDLFFSDPDKWKKRWQTLKNRINWRRWKPTPILVPVPTR